jgi:hypothetical protein
MRGLHPRKKGKLPVGFFSNLRQRRKRLVLKELEQIVKVGRKIVFFT